MQSALVIPFQFEKSEIRTLLIDDQPWFCVADICTVLGYVNSRDAISKHCREAGVAKRDIRSGGQMRSAAFINEGNLYRLIIKSRKQEAQRFESWVCDEVLPAIRKHGSYTDTDNKMGTLIGETIGTNGFNMLGSLIKGKVVSLPAQTQRRATAKIWSQTHAAFGVRSAADIPASQLDAARNFIAAYALEGEWLPPVERGTLLDEQAQNNLRALCHHAEWLLKNWNASLEPALRQVGSPFAGRFHDHFVSVAVLARSMPLRAANQSG